MLCCIINVLVSFSKQKMGKNTEGLDKPAKIGFGIQTFAIVFTFIAAACQINSSNNSSKLATATQLYDSYLEFAFENPKYADGYHYGDVNAPPEERQKYTWYVSRVLFIAEEILSLDIDYESKNKWCQTIYSQMTYHQDYLLSSQFQADRNHYSTNVIEMFDHLRTVGQTSTLKCNN